MDTIVVPIKIFFDHFCPILPPIFVKDSVIWIRLLINNYNRKSKLKAIWFRKKFNILSKKETIEP